MFVLWLLKTSAIGFVIRQPKKVEFFKKSWPRQEYNKNVRNLMLPQWLCGRERLNAWTDVVRIVRRSVPK